jgi:membrane fusion protein (multidrug efflux system)
MPEAATILAPRPSLRDRARKSARTLLLIGLALLIAFGVWLVHYLTVGRYMESTDNAYLQADSAVVVPKVNGTVLELDVTDNQRVKAGQVLLKLDDRIYRARFEQSQADVASAEADLANAEAQIVRQQAAIAQAKAQVAAAEADAQFAARDAARYAKLASQGAASLQTEQRSTSNSKSSKASLIAARAGLESAQKQLDVVKAEREKAAAALEHSKAVHEQDRINLEYTTIIAPIDGVIGDRTVRMGEFLQAGTRLMTIVPTQTTYLVANYKETQVRRMKRGAPVNVTIDAFPGVTYHGHVDSLSPGTGAQFALLPPENATGNFTKIVQRVPVKIVFDGDNKNLRQLRPGLSATAVVDTKAKPAADGGKPLAQSDDETDTAEK